MAINYPTSLDSFTNPSASSLLTSPSHAQQHADINDAMEAVQTKLAIGNTVIGTYTAYTPTLNQITIGDGTIETKYCRVNDFVHYYGKITFGSTTVFTGSNASFTLPLTADVPATNVSTAVGKCYFYDLSAGTFFSGTVPLANSTAVYGGVNTANQNYVRWATWTSTAPFTWATGDFYTFNITYKAA
jgi:hypothetical protein